jgi:ADP-ribose pyrophosphatase YjhB (NUDIX family)
MREIQRMAYRAAGRLPSPLKRMIVRMHEARFLVGILGVVTDAQGRVLLFRHTYRPFAPWGLPSGLLKPDESPGAAIIREVREETGLALGRGCVLRARRAAAIDRGAGAFPPRASLAVRVLT